MRKSGLTGDEAYVLSKHGKTTEDLGPLKKEVSSIKEDLVDLNDKKITKFYASNQGETHITDSDNGKIQDVMIYGKFEQKQYIGKNLINSDEYYSEYKQSDGTYKGRVVNFHDILVPVGKYIGTQITASCKVIVPSNTSLVWVEATIDGAIMNGNRITSGKSGVTAVTIIPKTEDDTIDIAYGTGGNEIIVVSEFQIEKGSEATSYEPYVGGQPSPSPNYPQEIKSVVNPTVKVTNEDGLKVQSITLNNITLNAISVSSGGNVTIDGQQYIADYVDVNRGKLVKKLKSVTISDIKNIFTWGVNKNTDDITGFYFYTSENGLPKTNNDVAVSTILHYNKGTWGGKSVGCAMSSDISNNYAILSVPTNILEDISSDKNACASFTKICEDTNAILFYSMISPIETDLTPEEIEAFKELVTYYPVTSVSVNSEQLDGYTVFNYPISMQNGWNYVKQQLNDNRDYIYDMDAQSAEAYVNSEYAVALTELEV